MRERHLSEARWSLLQTLVEGLKCVNPDRFQRDCGNCFICRCRYRDGALIGYDPTSLRSIPGTKEMRTEAEEFRRHLKEAMQR